MGKVKELRSHMEEAFQYAVDDGYEAKEELVNNYAKYHLRFTGFKSLDPLGDVEMFLRELDDWESPY